MKELPPIGPAYPARQIRPPQAEGKKDQRRRPSPQQKPKSRQGDQDDPPHIDEYA
ncbi:MAG: hypothetical protein WBN31_07395 [Gammaproteobacteria bacterium]